ncbi:MAG TPA: glycosyltransferase [Polyangia bacterium]|nr:glycosyltransferase [Polyangia bacterium]
MLALILLSAVALLRAPTLVVPIFNSDEAYLAVQAHVLRDGGRLYHDVADRKPPLVPYLYAATFAVRGADDLIAVHVLAIGWLFATALVLAWDAKQRSGASAGLWAAALFVAASASYLPAETQAANFEVFMLLPACLGMALAGRGKPLSALAAGALIAAATLCKQTAAVTLLAAGYRVFTAPRRGLGLLALGAAFVTVLGVTAAALGPREFYFWTVGGNAGYLSADGVLSYAFARFAIITGSFLVANFLLCWLVTRAARTRARRDLDLWVWLFTSAIGVAAGLRFFGHYYLQLLPPACLLAAAPASELGERARKLVAVGLTIPALVFASLGFYSARIHDMPDYRPLAAYVREHTAPTDRIAIWGHFPEVYWASGRMPAMRFVHTGFLTGASGGRPAGSATEHFATPGAWELLFQDFHTHPPRLVIDTSPARLRDYEHYPIARYPRLRDYLSEHYHQSATVDGMVIYARTDSASTAAIR